MTRHDRTTRDPVLAEGFFSEIFNALTAGAFLTALARLLGAGPMSLAFLVALPLLAQIGQCAAPMLLHRVGSYRRLVVGSFWSARLLWLVPALLPLFGLHASASLGVAMISIFLMAVLGMVGTHTWTAWMAEVVPAADRTETFGLRLAAVTCGTLVAALGGALLLDHLKQSPLEPLSYALLGGAAVLAGWAGVGAMRQLPSPMPRAPSCSHLAAFVVSLRQRPRFVRLLAFFIPWGVAIGIPAPFWSLCMLERLHMSFLLICLHDALVLVTRLVCNGAWTRLLARVGARRVLLGCALFISLNPVIWLFLTPERLWPIWFEAVWCGILWTGFNQAAFLEPLEVLEPSERGHGLAVFNVATGGTQFVASLVGGLLMKSLGANAVGYATIFSLSAILRLASALMALHQSEPLGARAFVRRLGGHIGSNLGLAWSRGTGLAAAFLLGPFNPS